MNSDRCYAEMPQSELTSLTASLVGCGRIGAFTRTELTARLGANWLPLSHLDAALSTPNLELISACDPNAGALGLIQSNYPTVRTYTNLSELLEASKPDILLVATRSDARPSVIELGTKAGIRGLHCEKPLATSLELVEDCIANMTKANAHFSYGALRRYMGIYEAARKVLSAGELGDITNITVKFGMGGLMWVHPHSIDLLCFLNSDTKVATVQANFLDFEEHRKGSLIDCDPVLLSANIQFNNGCIGLITPQPGLAVEISGTAEALSIIGDGAFSLRHPHSTAKMCEPVTQWKFEKDLSTRSGRCEALAELCMSVRTGHAGRLSLSNVLEHHKILFGLVQSHLEGGKRISLDDIDPSIQVTGAVNGLNA